MLLTYDNVRFAIHPVASYFDLQGKFARLMEEQLVREMAKLCGANTRRIESQGDGGIMAARVMRDSCVIRQHIKLCTDPRSCRSHSALSSSTAVQM